MKRTSSVATILAKLCSFALLAGAAKSFAVRPVGSFRLVHIIPAAFAASDCASSSTTSRSLKTRALSSTMSANTEQETKQQERLENVSNAYKTLVAKFSTIIQLERVNTVLQYDQMVFMPSKASGERGAQMAALAGLLHEKATDPELLTLMNQAQDDLKAAAAASESFKDEARLLEIEQKSFLENARVSSEVASQEAALKAKAHQVWAQARKDNNFAAFEPVLKECFDMAKQLAEAKRGDSPISHYAQMLDQFEMGMDPNRIDAIFDQIQTALVPLLEKVLGETATPPSTDPLKGEFPLDKQKELTHKIVTQLGYDADFGRLDVSVHPFTMAISPSDVRITSRFRTDEWYQGLAATIHEGGHAIYEQNVGGGAANGLKLDTYLSMGMHESQSLFWERHVGLSKPFWVWAVPLLKEAFGDDKFPYTPDQVYGAVNAVSRGFIRVEADELTYPLHVILRYQIEREVIQGKLEVSKIPERWNSQMKEMLGADVPSDTLGCLQDVHWSALAIGYFPTYLIGSSAAAQLAYYCKKDLPDFDEKIAKGEFAEIKAWLKEKVHQHGKRYKSLDALLEAELGEPLNPKYFIDYLTEKYTDLYHC